MMQQRLPALAGIVDVVHSDPYAVDVQIFDAKQQGIFVEGARYAVVCVPHRSILGTNKLSDARLAAYRPGMFCPDCQLAYPAPGDQALSEKIIRKNGGKDQGRLLGSVRPASVIPADAPDKWRNEGPIGSWHSVSGQRAFRFYRRLNQRGEIWFFADYRIEDLRSSRHKLFRFDDGIEKSWKHANTTVLDLTRDQLANLD